MVPSEKSVNVAFIVMSVLPLLLYLAGSKVGFCFSSLLLRPQSVYIDYVMYNGQTEESSHVLPHGV